MEDIYSSETKKELFTNIIIPYKRILETLVKGENLIVDNGNELALLKFEDVKVGSFEPNEVRLDRSILIRCMIDDAQKDITEKAKIEIYATHRINFTFDEEFGIYLPSSDINTDLFLNLADRYKDGSIKRRYKQLSIISDEDSVRKRMQEVTRPDYFYNNILPFLENRETNLEMPKSGNVLEVKRRKNKDDSHSVNLVQKIANLFTDAEENIKHLEEASLVGFDRSVGRDWLSTVAKELDHGDFVYIGSKEEVYLLGIAKNKDGSLYGEEGYIRSTKPLLWFSNNYLGKQSHLMRELSLRLKEKEDNPSDYILLEPPSVNLRPFIFSAMGRAQDYKNSIFTGKPDLITGNLKEALDHFKRTDFREFEDIVISYATKIRDPTPNARSLEKYFY
jgi:hypothetical protein